jgi:hypothetical protein
MTCTNSSNVNELSTPLLGKRPQYESDEEQGCIPCSSPTLAIVYDDEEESCQQKAAEDESQWTNILAVTSVVLPALLHESCRSHHGPAIVRGELQHRNVCR